MLNAYAQTQPIARVPVKYYFVQNKMSNNSCHEDYKIRIRHWLSLNTRCSATNYPKFIITSPIKFKNDTNKEEHNTPRKHFIPTIKVQRINSRLLKKQS